MYTACLLVAVATRQGCCALSLCAFSSMSKHVTHVTRCFLYQHSSYCVSWVSCYPKESITCAYVCVCSLQTNIVSETNVASAQLWVLLLGQILFLVWLLVLKKVQVDQAACAYVTQLPVHANVFTEMGPYTNTSEASSACICHSIIALLALIRSSGSMRHCQNVTAVMRL